MAKKTGVKTERQLRAEATALARIREAGEKRSRYLDLRGLGLQTLPDELWELNELETLNIRSNRLTSIPAEIGRLKGLCFFGADNNQLRDLPDELFELPRLVSCDVDTNRLTAFPSGALRSESLATISFVQNKIQEILTRPTFR